jgi:ATP-dependent RNA helicase DDX24/MAK5
MLDKLRHRAQLARQIDSARHRVQKANHERKWLQETADALGVEIDSDQRR